MILVGCDYHPSFQQIAFLDIETGELKEQRLAHREGAGEPTVGKAKTINESGMAPS